MPVLYANIIIDITHEKVDRVFQYRIPEELIDQVYPGAAVNVPFGRGNRPTRGYVVEITEETDYPPEKIKVLTRIDEGQNPIEENLIKLAVWIRKNYGGTQIQALKTVLPVKQKVKEKENRRIRRRITAETAAELLAEYQKKHYTAKARLMEALLNEEEISWAFATGKMNITAKMIRDFEDQGYLQVLSEQIYRNPEVNKNRETKEHCLNEEQQAAVTAVASGIESGETATWLLYGITGSGKTQVYLDMISEVVNRGGQAIVLIPEIALTYQTVMRFYHRFGDRISIINSRLSKGERYDQFERAKRGEIDVMIGPRSALFTPFPNLGMIIIDEEHEASYKSEGVPRYHAREVAVYRAEAEGAQVVLGSATPSVDAYYRAEQGIYKKLTLSKRAAGNELPQVYTVDLRQELKEGNRSILSRRLKELMTTRLEKGEQIMLFLNRRGYAGFLSCRACGHVIKCPHCDVSLTIHNSGQLKCHYCGYEQGEVNECPECGSGYIGRFKAGTQQIEGIVQKEFPEARILRMDLDTTKGKEGHETILSAFSDRRADILIGTQMIVKGHDFPGVTLVGVLAADLSLHVQDYRAAERTFQLLTQAAGRAGRGEQPGEVVIQTYDPEHYSLVTAAAQDYESFYEEEILYRKLMQYPPVSNLMAVHLAAKDEKLLEMASEYLKKYAMSLAKGSRMSIIGPAEPGIARINDVYRKVIYLKHKEYEALVTMKDKLEQYIEVNEGYSKISVQFDFNPMS